MNQELSFKTAICPEYERLLITCNKAMELWRNRHEEIVAHRSIPKKAADELLRLQALYAKAYARVEQHNDFCALCRFVSKIGGRNQTAISNPALDKRRLN
jgi:hypothetical protein